MPLPTTWDSLPYVGPARGNRPNTAACTNQKIRGTVRRRQSSQWATGHAVLPEVRCCDIWGFLAEAYSPPAFKSSNHRSPGQCALPSCDIAQATVVQLPKDADSIISTALQSGSEPSRKSLEVGPKTLYSQQIFSDSPGSCCRSVGTNGCLEKAKPGIV
jgi:hypothetical protein